ncbi:MAG TPA: HNH endonuclease signature motif containing protein [Polyangia bacterium]|nr:HNH endonuclease signature motif containing protein [Polyangia bacterium]
MSRCWLWTGHVGSDGYGAVRVNGRLFRAHRLAYTVFVGPIPDGCVLHHLCDEKTCINPEHLAPMPLADHMRHHNPLRETCARGHSMTNAMTNPSRRGRACRVCFNAARRARQEKNR